MQTLRQPWQKGGHRQRVRLGLLLATALLAITVVSAGVFAAESTARLSTVAAQQGEGFWYTVQAGDYLSSIAARFNTTVAAIVSANNISNPNIIRVGQQLWIPGSGGAPEPTPTGDATPTAPGSEGFWYTVVSGDNLSRLAARFGTTVAAIMSANNITNANIIRVGQQLWIPGTEAAPPTTTPQPTETAQPTPTDSSGGFYYTVRPGDTLSAIAARFGVTLSALIQANNITNANVIRVGQQLWIPAGGGTPEPAPTTPGSTPAPPPTNPGSGFGYGFGIQPWGADMEFVVNATRGAGFNWVRFQVPWKDFERDGKGQYSWGDLDHVINSLNAGGINIAVSIVKAPAWARPGNTDLSVDGPPSNPQDYADFLSAFMGRFAGKVQAVELWNEPNLWHEWGHEPLDSARFVRLLCAGYAAVKAQDPNARVISGGLTPTGVNDGQVAIDDIEFLRQMYQNGARNCFDGLGAHPSGYNNPPDARFGYTNPSEPQFKNHPSFFFQETMLRYRNVMTSYGDSTKRIWPTEFGWASSETPVPGYEYAADVTLQEQAEYLVRSYQMMNSWGWVGPAFAWNLNFNVVNPSSEMAQFGLWDRPAYGALQTMPK